MKRIGIFALAVAALAGAAAPAPAVTAAVCTFEAVVTLDPGVSMTPAKGTFTTGGETGTIDCGGFIGDAPITGPGTVGFDGSYGSAGSEGDDTCALGSGRGVFSFTISAGIGVVSEGGGFSFVRAAVGGEFAGRGDDLGIAGAFQFEPLDGDCVNTPVTRARVTGQATLSGDLG